MIVKWFGGYEFVTMPGVNGFWFFKRVRSCPPTLRMIMIGLWVGGLVAMMSSMLPGWENEAGESISRRQMWENGTGAAILAAGAGIFGLGCLICWGRDWVRHLLMLVVVANLVPLQIGGAPCALPLALGLAIDLALLAVVGWYLYFRRYVARYFSSQSDTNKVVR